MLDSGHLASLTALHSFTCTDVPVLLSSISRADLLLLASDYLFLELPLSPRSFAAAGSSLLLFGLAWAEPSSSILDSARSGLFTPLRAFASPDLSTLVCSLARIEALLFSLDLVNPDLGLSLRAFARIGPVVLVSDFARLEPPPSLRSAACMGSVPFTPDFIHPDPSLLMQSFAQAGAALLALDFLHPGALLPLKSFGRLEVPLPVLSATALDSLLLLHGFSRPGFLILIVGLSCIASLAFVLDLALLGFFSFLRSAGYFDLVLSVPGFFQLGSFSLPHGFSRSGSILLVSGTCPAESSIFVLDFASLGLLISLKGLV